MSYLHMIWDFVNSPLGITLVTITTSFVLGKIYVKKPKWKAYAEKYRPIFVAAVKEAEKRIPDNMKNKNVKRLDCALKLVLEVNGRLNEEAAKDAITHVHADLESGDNL